MSLLLSGCNNYLRDNGKEVSVYGFFNQEARQNKNYVYEVSAGSVICGILFCQTIIVPIYVIGWDLFQPVRKR